MLSIILALITTLGFEEKKYPVAEIPEELKKNVNVVFRIDEATFAIEAKNNGTYHVHQVITILNKSGDDEAEIVVSYDKLRKVNMLKGTVYDGLGSVIKKLKSSDIKDQSAISQGTLFQDDRVKYASLAQAEYPYTVEFEYEIEFKFLFYIPTWQVMPNKDASVQISSFTLSYPANLLPRYKLLNSTVTPVKEANDGKESLTWTFTNIMPDKKEAYSPSLLELRPFIEAAPSDFQYEEYAGSMMTWQQFGQWQQTLLKGREVLPPELKTKVKELTAGKKTNEEKAKALYEYMQSKTRYISVQLGIGGFQPFDAVTVDKTGYGDCKALSNYMVAMLHEANVPAYYTLISAGRNQDDIQTDFPSTQFNHVIAAVPNGKDTLWLECTSQINPFGYLGGFTGNRHALMITEKGGVLVKTPSYGADVNKQSTSATVLLDAAGNAQAKIATVYAGLQYENGGLEFTINSPYDDQKKWIQENTEIPSFDVLSFSMTNRKDKIPSAIVTKDLSLKRYATVSGKRLFLAPNLLNQSSVVLEKMEQRKTDIVRRTAYTDYDTIRYQFPENLYPEFLPEPIKISSRFGEYQASFAFDAGQVVYIRKMKTVSGRFPKESYNEMVDFFKAVNKADRTKLVFLNKT